MRSAHCSSPGHLLLSTFILLLIGGCSFGLHVNGTETKGADFAVFDVRAQFSAPQTSATQNSAEYYLAVLVDPAGFDYSSDKKFLNSLMKKGTHTVGHAWILMSGPDMELECGHTGEFGLRNNKYFDGVIESMLNNEADPAAYLWKDFNDGKFERYYRTENPRTAVLFSVTKARFERAYQYINSLNYEFYSLTKSGCTHFAINVARAAGIELGHLATIKLPQNVKYDGELYTLYTSRHYSTLSFGSPEVLEMSLKKAVALGLGADFTKQYHNAAQRHSPQG